MSFWQWLGTVSWGAVVATVLIPIAAIIIPTLIAIGLARRERADARANSQRERRLAAGAGVILALAPLASLTDLNQPMSERLWDLRARIAVYRAWIEKGDLSGDWLALRHKEGMQLWAAAMFQVQKFGGPDHLDTADLLNTLKAPHDWAATTTEMFSGWLSGNVDTGALQADGARIIALPSSQIV